MKSYVIIPAAYALLSVVLYLFMRRRCERDAVFVMPKKRLPFYMLSFSWGLPMTLFGCLVALILVAHGKKPRKYGWDFCFELDGIDWGLELGIFFIVPKSCSEAMKYHEHGHGIQNIYLGVFTPAVVSLPSAARFWFRKLRTRLGKQYSKRYDDIWFEKSATESGYAFMSRK